MPNVFIAVLVGMGVGILDCIGDIGGQVPNSGRFICGGDCEVHFGQVACVIAVPRINGENQKIPLFDIERLARNLGFTAQFQEAFGQGQRSIGPAA